MIKDLYVKSPSDPNYNTDILDHSDPIESIKAKLKMILGTHQGQVFGDVNFGVGVEDLIFETKINKLQLEEKISSQIYQYVSESREYQIRPSVQFGKADGYDYCVIDFFINNDKAMGILVS
jgi:phage baseplate assembly protein W